MLKQRHEDQLYGKKMYFLKRTIKALIFKNAALCDEVSRLNQRIYTVGEERKMLAKRWIQQEKNRMRRIQVQQKKADARRLAAEKLLLVEKTTESMALTDETSTIAIAIGRSTAVTDETPTVAIGRSTVNRRTSRRTPGEQA